MTVTYETVVDLLQEFVSREEIDLKITSGTAGGDGSLFFDFPVGEFLSKLLGVAVDERFLTQLRDVASMQLKGDEIPGVINFKTATRVEVIDFLLASARMKATLDGLAEIVESNHNAARARLGRDMSRNNETRLEISDDHGNRVANILLEVKQRPSWEDKEYQFEFVKAIGQGDIIQETIPWQTIEKLMSTMIDELPHVPYDEKTGFDMSKLFDPDTVSTRALDKEIMIQAEQGYFDLSATPWAAPGVYFDDEQRKLRVFFMYNDGTYTWLMERLPKNNTQRLGKLYATTNAKVSKLYD